MAALLSNTSESALAFFNLHSPSGVANIQQSGQIWYLLLVLCLLLAIEIVTSPPLDMHHDLKIP